MNPLIQRIIAGKIPCYFISPHLDDAVFSAGGLIAYLSRRTRVEVITAFTEASPRPYTFSARAFLKQCFRADADALFNDRRSEDRSACALVGVTPHHLGHADALWRKIPSPTILRKMLSYVCPECLHVYPTYRMHIVRGGVSPHDTSLSVALGKELKEIVGTHEKYALFCPLALQTHVDHVLIRDACLANFHNVILWRDFPYNRERGLDKKKVAALGSEAFRWDAEKKMKRKMMESYASQVKAMFPNGNIPLVPEVYYVPRKKTRPGKSI